MKDKKENLFTTTIKTKDGKLHSYPKNSKEEVRTFLNESGMKEDEELKNNLSYKFV